MPIRPRPSSPSSSSGDLAFTSDPVRQIIAERCAALGITDAELSRMIGRNLSYMNQYQRRGSPEVLPDKERHLVAKAIGVAPETLDPDNAVFTRAAETLVTAAKMGSRRNVPTFSDTKPLDWLEPEGWARRPDQLQVHERNFALRITTPHERLNPGDAAYVSGSALARVGDLAVVMPHDYRRIVAIGSITRADHKVIVLEAGGTRREYARDDHLCLKVVVIVLA